MWLDECCKLELQMLVLTGTGPELFCTVKKGYDLQTFMHDGTGQEAAERL